MSVLVIFGGVALSVSSCRSDNAPLETTNRTDGGQNHDGAKPEPSACGPTKAAIPEKVMFRLVNKGAAPVFLNGGCVTEFGVSSCAAGYADNLGPKFVCACACNSPSCTGVACGACLGPHGVLVPAFGALNLDWTPERVEDKRNSAAVPCVDRFALSSGAYRLDVPVYASEGDAAQRRQPRVVHADFSLAGKDQLIVEAEVTGVVVDATPASFRLVNETGKPIFVQDGDYWRVLRDGVALPVQNTCAVCDCSTCPSCSVCGRALASVKGIAPGASHDFAWDGFARPQVMNGCRPGLECEVEEAVSPSSLQVSVTYSLSHGVNNQFGAPDDVIGAPVLVTADFLHPTPQVVVLRAR